MNGIGLIDRRNGSKVTPQLNLNPGNFLSLESFPSKDGTMQTKRTATRARTDRASCRMIDFKDALGRESSCKRRIVRFCETIATEGAKLSFSRRDVVQISKRRPRANVSEHDEERWLTDWLIRARHRSQLIARPMIGRRTRRLPNRAPLIISSK